MEPSLAKDALVPTRPVSIEFLSRGKPANSVGRLLSPFSTDNLSRARTLELVELDLDPFIRRNLIYKHPAVKDSSTTGEQAPDDEWFRDIEFEDIEIAPRTDEPQPKQAKPRYPAPDTEIMSQPTREEIDAKLQAMEARMDTRVAEVTGKIDSLLTKLDERDRLYQAQFSSIGAGLAQLSNLKMTIITTVIGTGAAIVGIFIATLGGMTSSFDSGRETAQLAASAQSSAESALRSADAANQAAGAAAHAESSARRVEREREPNAPDSSPPQK